MVFRQIYRWEVGMSEHTKNSTAQDRRWEIVLRFEGTEDQAKEAAQRVWNAILHFSDRTIGLTSAMLTRADDDQ
jgi:hypothetical protein